MSITDISCNETWIDEELARIAAKRPPGSRVAFVSGNFNIVHPGHLRLLNFAAECGDMLVVGVSADHMGTPLLPQDLRLAGIRSIGVVDHAFILPTEPDVFIRRLCPDIVVKGKEHEGAVNCEKAAVDSYGGRLLFCSGETRFSSLDLLHRELRENNHSTIVKPLDYLERHGFGLADLVPVVRRFANLTVMVVGDLIVDEYINCDALGMSQEDPTLVVSPIARDRFVGGAGIVAAHACGLGAKVRYFSVVGHDETARFAADTLKQYGTEAVFLEDDSRPTTLKQRYRVGNKTLLRVSHLRQHDISAELEQKLYERIQPLLADTDLIILSDFNYGVLPQSLVARISDDCRKYGIMMVADSQASSQIGDVSRFKGMCLLTPTEREARLAMRDTQSGLVVLAEALRLKAEARYVLLTLGGEGLLIHAPQDNPNIVTDRLPAFNTAPKDVSGAGDSLLTCSAMALAVGSDIWRGAYLGAVAAACQVGRVGNSPLSANALIEELLW